MRETNTYKDHMSGKRLEAFWVLIPSEEVHGPAFFFVATATAVMAT